MMERVTKKKTEEADNILRSIRKYLLHRAVVVNENLEVIDHDFDKLKVNENGWLLAINNYFDKWETSTKK